MPIYEYQCQGCGHELEAIQKVSEAPLTQCPVCERQELRKKLSASAFRLSGGGWYETDFKTGDRKRNLAGEAGGDVKPAADGKASGESKSGGDSAAPAAGGGSTAAATAAP
jgi:putative FmdB family regulatory protein